MFKVLSKKKALTKCWKNFFLIQLLPIFFWSTEQRTISWGLSSNWVQLEYSILFLLFLSFSSFFDALKRCYGYGEEKKKKKRNYWYWWGVQFYWGVFDQTKKNLQSNFWTDCIRWHKYIGKKMSNISRNYLIESTFFFTLFYFSFTFIAVFFRGIITFSYIHFY